MVQASVHGGGGVYENNTGPTENPERRGEENRQDKPNCKTTATHEQDCSQKKTTKNAQ